MKITISGTHEDLGKEVSITLHGDDGDITQYIDCFRYTLLAWGFAVTSVDKFLPEVCEDDPDQDAMDNGQFGVGA